MKKACLIMFFSLSIAQILPSGDPTYIYLRNEFRMNHDLSIFFSPYPFKANHFVDNKYQQNTKDALVRFIPQMTIWNSTPIFNIDLWASGNWDNLSILVEPEIVPDEYGEKLLGVDYTRAGVSGRITNAFIRYEQKNVIIQMGRSPIWWGQSWESSIIQSGQTPSFNNLDVLFNFGSFRLEILAGQLGSEKTVEDIRIRRNIAGHRLTWLPRNKRWLIGFGEQIVYTGVNRSLELTYLNPAIPYFFTALENEEVKGENGYNNDNSLIFFYSRYNVRKNLSLFNEFIIDDYQVDKNNIPNSLGWLMGFDGGINLYDRELTFEFVFTHIDSWSYIHNGEFTSWQNLGHPIGFNYGPDSRSVTVLADYWLKDNLLFSAKYTFLEKGKNNLKTKWDSPGTKGAPFPLPPTTIYNLTEFSLSWHAKYGILDIGYTNFPVGNAEINGKIDKLRGSLFFKAQLVWGFGFNLD